MKKKSYGCRVFRAVITLFFLLSPCFNFAENSSGNTAQGSAGLTAEEEIWLENRPVVSVANEMDWPPFDFAHKGVASGLSIDMIRLAADRVGMNLEFINGYSWTELLEKFNSGEIDVLPAVYKTPERGQDFVFTSSYALNPTVLVVRTENTDLRMIEDLYGKRVAIVSDFAITDIMRERCPLIVQMPVYNVEAGLKAVSLKQADAFIGSLGVITHLLDTLIIPDISIVGEACLKEPEETELHIGVLKENEILRDILQKGLDAIPPEERRALKLRWLPSTGVFSDDRETVLLSSDEKSWLTQHQMIRLGDDFSWPPFIFLDENNQFTGIAAGYTDIISRRLGVEFAPVTGYPWDEIINMIEEGSVDLLPAVVRTAEREEFINFTRPYISFPLVIATSDNGIFVDSIDDLYGLKTGIVKGYAAEEFLTADHPELNLIRYENIYDGLDALEHGRIDAFIDNIGSITYQKEQQNLSSIKIALTTKYHLDLAFGVRKDWPELVDILNKTLDTFDSQETAEIKNRWLAIEVNYGIDITRILIWAVPLVICIIIVVIIISFWNRRLIREVLLRKSSEDQFQAMTSNVPGAIFQILVNDIDFLEYIYISSKAEEFFGFSPETVIKEKKRLNYHVEDYEQIRKESRQAIEAETELNIQGRIIAKDDEVRWINLNATPGRNSRGQLIYDGFILDITDRKEIEQETERLFKETARRNEELEVINKISKGLTGELDLSRLIEFTGNELNRFFKPYAMFIAMYDKQEEVIYFPFCIDDWKRLETESLNYGEGLTTVILQSRKPLITGTANEAVSIGAAQPLDDTQSFLGVPILAGAEAIGVVSIQHPERNRYTENDVRVLSTLTDNLGMAIEKARLHKKTEEAMKTAEAATKSKSEFLANMSHEIRTPMNAITGMIHLAMQTKLTEKQYDYLNKSGAAAKSLLGIINDILDFSKIEAGKLDIENVGFLLEDVLENVNTLISIKAEDKGLSFEIDTAGDVPCCLVGDPLRLGQILINLANNAVKFTDDGKVTIKTELIKASPDNVNLQFSVRDTGIGLTQQQIGKLFKSFSQADSSTTRKYGGTGLGLTISKKLVEMMNGSIRVESEYTEGSAFIFTADFGCGDEEQIRAQAAGNKIDDDSLKTIQGARLLLAEDNEINQQVAREILENAGFIVDVTENGQQALDAVAHNHYDLVLMDIQMPVMDGYEAARKLRENPENDELPILAMSASVMTSDIEKAVSAGMNGHVKKPIELEQLYSALLKWIKPDDRRSLPSERQTRKQGIVEVILPRSISGIELDEGLGRLGGNKTLYLKLLKKFVCDFTSSADEVVERINDGDPVTAERIVHTIKGVAGNLGAAQMQKDAAALEADIKSGSNAVLQLGSFKNSLSGLVSAIESAGVMDNDDSNASACGDDLSAEELAEYLLELKPQIAKRRPKLCMPILEKILGYSLPESVEGDMHVLTEYLTGYKFKDAAALLDSMLFKLEEGGS